MGGHAGAGPGLLLCLLMTGCGGARRGGGMSPATPGWGGGMSPATPGWGGVGACHRQRLQKMRKKHTIYIWHVLFCRRTTKQDRGVPTPKVLLVVAALVVVWLGAVGDRMVFQHELPKLSGRACRHLIQNRMQAQVLRYVRAIWGPGPKSGQQKLCSKTFCSGKN